MQIFIFVYILFMYLFVLKVNNVAGLLTFSPGGKAYLIMKFDGRENGDDMSNCIRIRLAVNT